jgi:hypothetical protein
VVTSGINQTPVNLNIIKNLKIRSAKRDNQSTALSKAKSVAMLPRANFAAAGYRPSEQIEHSALYYPSGEEHPELIFLPSHSEHMSSF